MYSWCWSKAEVLELDLDPAPAFYFYSHLMWFISATKLSISLLFSRLSFVAAPAVDHANVVAHFLLRTDLFIYTSIQLTSPLKSSVILQLPGKFNYTNKTSTRPIFELKHDSLYLSKRRKLKLLPHLSLLRLRVILTLRFHFQIGLRLSSTCKFSRLLYFSGAGSKVRWTNLNPQKLMEQMKPSYESFPFSTLEQHMKRVSEASETRDHPGDSRVVPARLTVQT